VDDSARRILRVMFTAGLFEGANAGGEVDTPEQREVAHMAAIESIVLLKNESLALPLGAPKIRSVAVIGPSRCDRQNRAAWKLTGSAEVLRHGARRHPGGRGSAGAGGYAGWGRLCQARTPARKRRSARQAWRRGRRAPPQV